MFDSHPRPPDPSAGAPTFFRCELQQTGHSAAWLTLHGELDLTTSWYLAVRLVDAFADAHLVVVDLRDLSFIDAAGLGVIGSAEATARAGRRRLLLVRGSRQVERLMALTGMIERLDTAPFSLHDAPDLFPAI